MVRIVSKLAIREAIGEAKISFLLPRHGSKSICRLSFPIVLLWQRLIGSGGILNRRTIVIKGLITKLSVSRIVGALWIF